MAVNNFSETFVSVNYKNPAQTGKKVVELKNRQAWDADEYCVVVEQFIKGKDLAIKNVCCTLKRNKAAPISGTAL